jgi:phospholipid/cholesterol/gamma-HCH transport system substrate-binding protein
MKNTLETRLGMFVAIAMVAGFIIVEILGAGEFFKPGYHLLARFNSIQDLKLGDAVKMAGVPVGKVEKIQLNDGQVELKLKLNKDAPVHTDSKATIKFTGLMGQYYVDIEFGTPGAPRMAEGAHLTTTEQPDLSALMAKLDDVATGVQNLTRSFSGDKIDNILGPFTDFMKQNNPRLSAIFANVQAISGQISEGKGTVGKLVYDDALYTSAQATITNLQDTANEIKRTVADARTIVDQINAGQGTVGKLVKDDTLYRDAVATVSNANVTMANIREISDKINNGQGSVGKIVNDKEFYNNAKLSLQKLDKAADSLEDTGPLSLFGQIITTLF